MNKEGMKAEKAAAENFFFSKPSNAPWKQQEFSLARARPCGEATSCGFVSLRPVFALLKMTF
jgi:hypothetical protein